MKKTLSFLLIFMQLIVPLPAFTAEVPETGDVDKVLQSYFRLRYDILSTLVYDDSIKDVLSPDILQSDAAVNEADILDTMVKFRKAQLNDLRFSRYQYTLVYRDMDVKNGTAWVTVGEQYQFYFNCAPTVKNEGTTEHRIVLKKYADGWKILQDDYQDTDGIKKSLHRYFVDENLSMTEAKAKVLMQSKSVMNKRFEKLKELVGAADDGRLFVFQAGKPLAYARGAVERIDSSNAVTPIVVEGDILLPLRFVLERMGFEAVWDDSRKTAVFTRKGVRLEIKAGEKHLVFCGKQVPLQTPARAVHGRTLLSARALRETLGINVYQDADGLAIVSEHVLSEQVNDDLIQRLHEYFSVLYTKTDFPRIDGSTATYPLTIEMGKELLGLDEMSAKGFLTHNTTHNAYVNLINGSTDIIFVTPPSPEELKLAEEKGVELEVVPVCKEGFVFLVNKENPISNLTIKQVQDIYQGKITNWQEVGGEDRVIIPYQREANSGSQTLMESVVMKGLKLAQPPKETLVYGMGELIDRVADFSNAKNALGYSVYYFATRMYQNRSIKLLSIDGVYPEKKSIQNESYPFTSAYYAVLRKDEPQNSSARRLLQWLLGKEGQEIVDRSGFVPVN